MVGALAHLLARRFAHFVGAVGDRGFELQAVAALAFTVEPEAGAPARIRMAAGRADRLACDIEPGTVDRPGFEGSLEAPVGAAGAANGGEAAIEHRAQAGGGARRN